MMRRNATEYDANCNADATHLHQILATHSHDMAYALHMEAVQLAQRRVVPVMGRSGLPTGVPSISASLVSLPLPEAIMSCEGLPNREPV